MSRSFAEKTYPGDSPRPSVEVTRWENDKFLMAATPWGNKDVLKDISESYLEFLTASMADSEATSPFAKIPTLSPIANSLRAATMFANDKACKKYNNDAFTSGCEALVIAFDGQEMAWMQMGQPHLFLIRGGLIFPLEVAVDTSIDYHVSAPLPGRLIGLDRQIDIAVKTLALSPGDRFAMLARSCIPQAMFNLDFNKSSEDLVKDIFDAAVAADEKIPFWVSVFG
jgi:hypothetical protein